MYVDQHFFLSEITVRQIRALCLGGGLDIAPGPGGSRFSDWCATQQAFASAQIKLWDAPPIEKLAIVALYPSAQIVAHIDRFDPAPPKTRCHIPIDLNPGCWSFHDGTWQQLEEGRVYTMDPTKIHGAVNWGSTVRLQLLVDVR